MKRMSILIAAAAALFLAAAAHAESTKTGQVVGKSGLTNSLTIMTEDGDRLTYRTAESTQVQRDGRAVGLDAVREGAQVKVTSAKEPGPEQEATASRIELQADVAAPPPTRP